MFGAQVQIGAAQKQHGPQKAAETTIVVIRMVLVSIMIAV